MIVNEDNMDQAKFGFVKDDLRDLIVREEKRTDIPLGYVYTYVAYTDNMKNTVVLLFDTADNFVGAGTAIKSPVDKYNATAGFRKAAARALRSITVHEKRANGKRVRLDVR